MRRDRRYSSLHMRRIKVTNALSGDPIGVIGDVSVGGLRVLGRAPLAVGGCYDLRLHIPEKNGETSQVDVKVICQWTRKDPILRGFQIGCALDRPSKEWADVVTRLITRR